MDQEKKPDEDLLKNYQELKSHLENALSMSSKANDLREAKGYLIDVQYKFKGLKLRREDREELYGRLQDAFEEVNKKIDEQRRDFENEAYSNYIELQEKVEEAILLAENPKGFKETWNFLMEVQARFKGTRLLREHREILYPRLQEAFDKVKAYHENERTAYESDARKNYERLKLLVENGLLQAEETNQYKETREFLKKIQSEFKGIKLIPEQREELYARLRTAFDILSKRLDEFFRQKKKNWEVKMNYRVSEYSTEIFNLEGELEKERSYLLEIEDQLEIAISGSREITTLAGLKARIASAKTNIARKEGLIRKLQAEMAELNNRLTPEA